MKAGRELDCEIAEKIMGLNVQHGRVWEQRSGPGGPNIREVGLSPYSTSIEAAWPVFEWLCKQPYGENSAIVRLSDGRYSVIPLCGWVGGSIDEANPNYEDGKVYEPFGDTAAHAICLAALKEKSPGN